MRELKKVTNAWLEATSNEMLEAGIGSDDRSADAVRRWKVENYAFLDIQEGDNEAAMSQQVGWEVDKIKSFFLTQREKNSGYIDGLFKGVFYYDGEFWELGIPLVMGSPRINALHFLKMPEPPASKLVSDEEALRDYLAVFADSYDYAYSIYELDGKLSTPTSERFFEAADKHLRGVKALLYQEKVSAKAVEDARMTIEIFLKAYISNTDKADEDHLRSVYGHNLNKLAARCVATGATEIRAFQEKIRALPDIASRYKIEDRTFGELWVSYRLALQVAIAVLRPITGRDCRTAFKL